MPRKASLTPFVIPFFIAHQGCPHQCVFCNQHAISGASQTPITPAQVAAEIAEKLAWPRNTNRPVQVAFYGGSFTGLSDQRQAELLEAVAPFLHAGKVSGVRISTRPDFIRPDQVALLARYGVNLVELGVQSLDDEVLRRSARGHSVSDVQEAFALLQGSGFQVGGQLMVGLPGDNRRRAVQSAKRLAALNPDMVRLYPTLVMQGSPLAALYEAGRFQPWSLELAMVVCAAMKDVFDKKGITVARMGLQQCSSLEAEYLAGPHHPAFGELVLARQYYRTVRATLQHSQMDNGEKSRVLQLAQRDQSLFMGVNKQNWQRYQRRRLLENVEVVFDARQPRMTMQVL